MTKLNESLHVHCPYVRAKTYLHDALSQAARSRVSQLLQLSAFVPLTNVERTKTVRVQYAHATDPMHFDEPWQVQWAPEPGGMYPSFSGQLTVRADESYESSILELTGEYSPPLGRAGRIFDSAIGHTIAARTAQRLLSEIAAEMLRRYEAEESAKDALRQRSSTGATS